MDLLPFLLCRAGTEVKRLERPKIISFASSIVGHTDLPKRLRRRMTLRRRCNGAFGRDEFAEAIECGTGDKSARCKRLGPLGRRHDFKIRSWLNQPGRLVAKKAGNVD